MCHLLAHRLTARYPRLDFAIVEPEASSGDHISSGQSLLSDWFNTWSNAGREDPVVEHVPEIVPFDHEVGNWLE